jgi:NTE family protein
MNAFELQEKAVALDEASIRDLQLSSSGLLLGQKLEDFVNEQVRRQPLERLAKPFVAVATRLEDGERTVFGRGNTGQAVRASSSVPGVFQPVTIGKYHFVDGGVVSPVPVDAARQLGADVVIAVDISSKARGQAPTGMLGTIGQSIAIMGQKLGQAELSRADVIVRPQVLDIGGADFTQRGSAILEGEKAALAAMPQIRERIAQLQAAREEAHRLAKQKAAEAQHQACLDQRSRLRKLAGLAGLDAACPPPHPG